MYPEQARRPRLIAVRAIEHALDKSLLELVYRLIEEDAAFDHLAHQRFQLISHNCTLRKKISGRRLIQFAARKQPVRLAILRPSSRDNLNGQFGSRGLLVPADPLKVIANKLFVERG